MKTKSCFSTTVLIKDLTRFAPLWGCYSILLFLLWLFAGSSFYKTTAIVNMEIMLLVYILLVYAIICAICLFGDLYSPRRCYALHAMPVSRTAYFLTHCAAGLLFFLVPTGLFMLGLACYIELSLGYIAAMALALLLIYLFFFGMALLCSMLAGNRIGAVFVYGVCSFLGPVLEWIFTTLFTPLLYGVGIDPAAFDPLYPAAKFSKFCNTLYQLSCYPKLLRASNWLYVLICAGIGIWAAVLALVLYRRRKLENAGSFSAVKGLDLAFQLAFSLMFAVLLFNLIGYYDWEYFLLIPYMALGLFIARLLQKRTLNVFQPDAFIALGVLVAVLYGGIGLVGADAFHILDYVPEADRVASVELYTTEIGTEYSFEQFRSESNSAITIPADIKTVTQLHNELIQDTYHATDDMRVYLTYNLKNGKQIRRYYTYRDDSKTADQLTSAIYSWRALLGADDWDSFVEEVYYISVFGVDSPRDFFFCDSEEFLPENLSGTRIYSRSILEDFLEKLRQACDNGKMDQGSDHFTFYDVVICSRGTDGSEKTVNLVIPVTPSGLYHYLEGLYEIGCTSDGIIGEDHVYEEE